MIHSRYRREAGSSLLMVVVALTFILALAGAVSLVTANGLRASSRSTDAMMAFYSADAAAQVGNALVRSTGMAMQATTLHEAIGGHAVNVDVTEEASGLYKVTSTSNVNGEVSTVELWVTFETEEFDVVPQGGFETNIGDGVSLNGDLRVELFSNARISGYDHDAAGNELDDQTNGVPGLAMHDTPEDADWWVRTWSQSEVEGVPDATVNNAEDQSGLMNTLRDIAQATADVFVQGSTLLDDDAIGNYGTAAEPVLVYVSLGESETLRMEENFRGYGFIVVDIGKNSEIEIDDNVQWNGMILVRTHDDPSTGNGPIIAMDGNAKIIGALQMLLDINGTQSNGHQLLTMGSNSMVLYSHGLLDEIFHGDADTDAVPLQNVTSVTTFRG